MTKVNIRFDFSDLGISDSELQQLMQKNTKVALDDGFIFGAGGELFQRITSLALEQCHNKHWRTFKKVWMVFLKVTLYE
ncbi:hypothetical protein [Metaclostridioides mangenotii]|uniref:hypothetical protein n=1 Tax=Metaclostridioides mangenotii TaxID=1540 RepID=UPI00047F5246|nr:hypothetical protein [Clostridioides mangenotii]